MDTQVANRLVVAGASCVMAALLLVLNLKTNRQHFSKSVSYVGMWGFLILAAVLLVRVALTV